MTSEEINEICSAAGILLSGCSDRVEVSSLSDDSRNVDDGGLFVAVRGNAADGHEFITDAASRGARLIVAEEKTDVDVPLIEVSDSRHAVALIASHWYRTAMQDSTAFHAVTGTNGKSSTVRILAHLNGGAWLGTLGGFMPDGRRVESPALTTPGPIQLHRILAGMRSGGAADVSMETSSHALDQRRADGIPFCTGTFTNLTHEHLDYHGDLMAYLEAKLRLIDLVDPDGALVVNRDSKAWDSITEATGRRVVEYSMDQPTLVRVDKLEPHARGFRFDLHLGDDCFGVDLPLLGDFNVSNAIGAAAAAWAGGVEPTVVAERLLSAPSIPGRMEVLHSGDALVIRDYAHTADSYELVLSSLRKATAGRLIVVFGCGGDRDRKKRPDMARIAGRISDLAIITVDNPRTEDPDRIYSDIEEGLGGYAHMRIDDREEGIRRGISMLDAGDTLVLLGKGHETYQIIGNTRQPFDEEAIVLDAMGAG